MSLSHEILGILKGIPSRIVPEKVFQLHAQRGVIIGALETLLSVSLSNFTSSALNEEGTKRLGDEEGVTDLYDVGPSSSS